MLVKRGCVLSAFPLTLPVLCLPSALESVTFCATGATGGVIVAWEESLDKAVVVRVCEKRVGITRNTKPLPQVYLWISHNDRNLPSPPGSKNDTIGTCDRDI